LEALERVMRELLVPFVCLVENTTANTTATPIGTAAAPVTSSKLSSHGNSSKISDSSSKRTTLSTRDMTINSTSGSGTDCASAVHPTVSVLADFICSPLWGDRDIVKSIDLKVNPSSLPVDPTVRIGTGREKDRDRDRAVSAIDSRKDEECWVFAMFTDDTSLPLSVHLTNALVAQLPQLPLFCLVSDSILLPVDVLPHIASPNKPCPPTSPCRAADSDFSEAFKDAFIASLSSIRLQNWDFGSAYSSAMNVNVDIALHQDRQQAELLGSVSCNNCVRGNNRVDWVCVREILSHPAVAGVLSVGHTYLPQSAEVFSPPDAGKVMVAGLVGGTLSYRKAACDVFPDPFSQVAISDADCFGIVRNFLFEADLVRCNCHRAITDGTLSVSGIKVQSPQPIPGLPVAQGGAAGSNGTVGVKQPTSVKWVVPWLCLFSAAARSALKRPNISQVTPHCRQITAHTDHSTAHCTLIAFTFMAL
jgi:hypothetical protein